MTRPPVKLVILGTDHSHWGMIANAATSREDVRLTAIAHETASCGEDKLAEMSGVKSYQSYARCLADEAPRIVGVAMHHGARGRWIAEALRSGADVIADKPLCMDPSELAQIREAQLTSGGRLCLMLTERCNPAYAAMRDAVREGRVGEVVGVEATRYYALNRPARPAWMFHRETYAGPVRDLLIHDYDLARWMTGLSWDDSEAVEVRSGRYKDRDFKDVAVLSGMERGKPLNLMALWHSPSQHRSRFTVYGSEGYLDLPLGSAKPVLGDGAGIVRELPVKQLPSFMDWCFTALLGGKGELPIGSEESLAVTECLIRACSKQKDRECP